MDSYVSAIVDDFFTQRAQFIAAQLNVSECILFKCNIQANDLVSVKIKNKDHESTSQKCLYSLHVG